MFVVLSAQMNTCLAFGIDSLCACVHSAHACKHMHVCIHTHTHERIFFFFFFFYGRYRPVYVG